VAKATKNMPAGKGTYGSKRGRPAKKSTAAKKPVTKKPMTKRSGLRPFGESNAAKSKGTKKMPPAMLKRMEEMKKKKKVARQAKK